MRTLANSGDPDEMLHQSLHYFGKQWRPRLNATCGISSVSALFAKTKSMFRKRITILFDIITCDPSTYTMDHPDFIVCSFMESSIGLKRVKQWLKAQGFS